MGTSIVFRAGACLALLLLLTPLSAFGSPFLVSDAYPKSETQPTRFDVVCGTVRLSRPPENLPNGSKRLKLDLSVFPDGELTLEIRAVERHQSESTPVSVRLLKNGQNVTLLPAAKEPPPPLPTAPRQKMLIPPSRTYQGHLNAN